MNRERLNEALAWYDDTLGFLDAVNKDAPRRLKHIAKAARWAASFPTDEDVAIAQKAMLRFGPMASMQGMRAALEAVALGREES
jgi:hypothetical protein